MIRLNGTLCDQGIGALLQRLRGQEFKLACLVSTRSQPCTVVSFDIKIRAAQMPGKVGHEFERRGEMSEANPGKGG
jgi:hypothetical protein